MDEEFDVNITCNLCGSDGSYEVDIGQGETEIRFYNNEEIECYT